MLKKVQKDGLVEKGEVFDPYFVYNADLIVNIFMSVKF